MMKRIYTAILFSLLVPFTSIQAANGAILDRIVAVVNDDIILQSELELAEKLVKFNMSFSREGQRPNPEQLSMAALQGLIRNSLVVQSAGFNEMRLSEMEIDTRIEGFSQIVGIKPAELPLMLARFNITVAEFRKYQEKEMIVARIAQRMLLPQISVTQQEVDNHIANLKAQGQFDAKRTREDIEQELFSRKFSEQYQLLIIRLQNEAHIDIRI